MIIDVIVLAAELLVASAWKLHQLDIVSCCGVHPAVQLLAPNQLAILCLRMTLRGKQRYLNQERNVGPLINGPDASLAVKDDRKSSKSI